MTKLNFSAWLNICVCLVISFVRTDHDENQLAGCFKEKMVMDPMGPGTKNDCAGESPQQLTQNRSWSVTSQESALVEVVGCEHRSRRISTVRSRYLVTTSDNITNSEDLVCAVVICSVCRLVRLL
jgi:hypothetical protein